MIASNRKSPGKYRQVGRTGVRCQGLLAMQQKNDSEVEKKSLQDSGEADHDIWLRDVTNEKE